MCRWGYTHNCLRTPSPPTFTVEPVVCECPSVGNSLRRNSRVCCCLCSLAFPCKFDAVYLRTLRKDDAFRLSLVLRDSTLYTYLCLGRTLSFLCDDSTVKENWLTSPHLTSSTKILFYSFFYKFVALS